MLFNIVKKCIVFNKNNSPNICYNQRFYVKKIMLTKTC